jgi:BirA family transcriptional regulator, biotin operon repressor / biotin---[acetyl-CoA-carboxylase] ligase
LNIGGLRYFDSIGSTNDEALAWAASGAKDLSIVIADEQTQGRGRLDRTWFTPKDSALAFQPDPAPHRVPAPASLSDRGAGCAFNSRFLSQAWTRSAHQMAQRYFAEWKKTAGILIETVWSGEDVDSLVIGMGVNIPCESLFRLRMNSNFPPRASKMNWEGNRLPARKSCTIF